MCEIFFHRLWHFSSEIIKSVDIYKITPDRGFLCSRPRDSRGTCAGAQLQQFNMVSHLEIWSCLVVRGNVFVFSSLTLPDRTRQSTLGTCFNRPAAKRWTISHTVQISPPENFVSSLHVRALLRTWFHRGRRYKSICV